MMKLTELQQDVLKESFNMGIGKAAAIVSDMVQKEVVLSVPNLRISSIDEMIRAMNESNIDKLTGVYQKCSGSLNGTALLLYSHESSLELIASLLNTDSKPEKLGEVEAEALKDFGNITLSTCLEELGKVMGGNISTDFPQILVGDAEYVMGLNEQLNRDKHTLSLEMEFTVKGSQNIGKINLNLDAISDGKFSDKLEAYCKQLLGE